LVRCHVATDGEATYTDYSGAQLLEALESIDRARYPKNYANLRRELATRPAPGPSLVEGGEVVGFVRLPRVDARRLLVRAVIALAIFEILGSIVGMFVAIPFLAWAVHLVTSDHLLAGEIVGFVLQAALSIGIAVGVGWAFLRWLLERYKGKYVVRAIRVKAGDS
jgi:hypothetical protein